MNKTTKEVINRVSERLKADEYVYDSDAWYLINLVKLQEADHEVAAGECLIDIPEPGTDLAKLLIANSLLRHENTTLNKRIKEIENNLNENSLATKLKTEITAMSVTISHIENQLINLRDKL